jgi:multidrug resistance efflux pump
VDIRPQITSTVTKVHIKEGQFVRAGDLLFTLDSRTDEVNLAKAQAQLDKIWQRWLTISGNWREAKNYCRKNL